jgi:hypothetical protein
MLKIVALTDLSKDESGDEEETITQVTKEAQVNRIFKILRVFFYTKLCSATLGDHRGIRIHASFVTEAKWKSGLCSWTL